MASINPYLNFKGNAEEAFNFYKSVFGGEFAGLQRFKDMPDGAKMAEEDSNKIMHISLPIGKGNILMASDVLGYMGENFIEGNNFHLCISPDSEEEAKRLYEELSAGGEKTMPLEKAFWGAYFGMLVDKFGVRWMISYDENQQS